MVDIGELMGPKVLAEREQTADSGGGQLRVGGGKLFVQAKLLARNLGPLERLESIHFEDRRRARLRFMGSASWILTDEEDGRLLEFVRDIEMRLGRPGLVIEPPPVADRMRRAITPSIKRQLVFVGVALAAIWPTKMLCATALPIAYAVLALTMLWFALLIAADVAFVQRSVPRWVLRRGDWGSHILLPVALALGAGFGALDARDDAWRHARATLAAQAAEADRVAQEKAQAEEQARDKARVDDVVRQLTAAVEGEQPREAEKLAEKLSRIAPGHPAIVKARAAIAPALAELAEEQRKRDIVAGVRMTKRVTSDRVACEGATTVGEAWKLVRQVRPDDELYKAASKLLPKLERCRQRVARAIVQNAIQTRALERDRALRVLENQLKSEGMAAQASLADKAGDEVVVTVPKIDQARANDLAQAAAGPTKGIPERLATVGVRRLVITDGKAVKVVRRLEPPDLGEFAGEILAGFGLDEPLALAQ